MFAEPVSAFFCISAPAQNSRGYALRDVRGRGRDALNSKDKSRCPGRASSPQARPGRRAILQCERSRPGFGFTTRPRCSNRLVPNGGDSGQLSACRPRTSLATAYRTSLGLGGLSARWAGNFRRQRATFLGGAFDVEGAER